MTAQTLLTEDITGSGSKAQMLDDNQLMRVKVSTNLHQPLGDDTPHVRGQLLLYTLEVGAARREPLLLTQ